MNKRKVFVIMPFKDEFFEVYEMLKSTFGDSYEFSNAGDECNQQNILKDIIQPIYESDIIIADLTGLNANVMYELGLAHCFNKKTIIITQDDLSNLPFDLKQYRAKDYNTHFKKFAQLVEYLEKNLNGAVDNTVTYSNPVKDFLVLSKIENINWFNDKPIVVLGDDSNKGFLDYLADIEDNVTMMIDAVNIISGEMKKMNNSVAISTTEIERVKKNGGNGVAAFTRKEAKKIAGYIDTFSSSLRNGNIVIRDQWDKIEKDTLGLLENQYISNNENKPQLIEYLIGIKNMKTTIDDSKVPFNGLKDIMIKSKGLERSLNHSIDFLVSDLTDYLVILERIQKSIDKILEKSRFVVGDI